MEEFKWKTNYRFLMGRAITIPRDVSDSPPFKSFNTDEEESFQKKKNQTALQPNRRSSVLMQELGMSLQGWAEGAEWAFLTSSTRILGSAAGLELIHTGLG